MLAKAQLQLAPQALAPSSAHVALAIALIRAKPANTTARAYILQLRDQIRPGASTSTLDDQHYLDLVAYWKERCEQLQKECNDLRTENNRLERSNHSLTKHTACVPDKSSDSVTNALKRKARGASPTRTARRRKGDQPIERSLAETQDDINDDMDFLDKLGQDGMNLTEALFTTHKLCRATNSSSDTLCYALVRTANALGKAIRLVAYRQGHLSGQSHHTSSPASLDQDKSSFALAMKICARGFMSTLVGLGRLTEWSDDVRLINLVVCELVDMFKTALVAIETTARHSAQQSSPQSSQQRRARTQDEASVKLIKESLPARAIAHLLIGMLGFLEKSNTIHQQIFDGFVYLLLERAGQRLFYCTFGRHRSSTVAGDIEPTSDLKPDREDHDTNAEALGTHLEVKALIVVLERAIGLAPSHMNPQIPDLEQDKKRIGRTLSLKNLPATSKSCLSPVAKERLQRTLIACMYGSKIDDEFLDVLTKPMPPMRLGSLPNVSKVEDRDVDDWYKKELWRLVGWDVLAKESEWL